jgi:hypothetical protein
VAASGPVYWRALLLGGFLPPTAQTRNNQTKGTQIMKRFIKDIWLWFDNVGRPVQNDDEYQAWSKVDDWLKARHSRVYRVLYWFYRHHLTPRSRRV